MSIPEGVDVSHFQGQIDWQRVGRAGSSFAYAKASEGAAIADEFYQENRSGATSAGIPFGAYHMYRFDQEPAAQAELFLALAAPKRGDLPPAIDLERPIAANAVRAVADVLAFLEIVERVTGVRSVIYVGYYFWRDALAATSAFANHPLWLAQYGDPMDPSKFPTVWRTWTFWQYSDEHQVDGIAGNVDADRFNGDSAALLGMRLR